METSRRRFLEGLGLGALATGMGLGIQGVSRAETDRPGQREPLASASKVSQIRLDQNENPLGPSPRVAKILSSSTSRISEYPQMSYGSLREVLGRFHGVSPSWVVPTCGSTEALQVLFRAFVREGSGVVHASPTFHQIPPLVELALAESRSVASEKDGTLDPRKILRAIDRRTSLLLLINPHNPTGTVIDQAVLRQVLSAVPTNLVVAVDEAYCHYASKTLFQSVVPLIARHPGLVVLRSFSKAYGLAGLRVGYALAQDSLSVQLDRQKLVAGVGSLAESAVPVALEDQAHVQRSVDHNKVVREELAKGLIGLGFNLSPSEASFVRVDLGRDASDLVSFLAEGGFLVHRSAFDPKAVRISVGTAPQTRALLDRLRNWSHG